MSSTTIAGLRAAFARTWPGHVWTDKCQAVMYQICAMLGTVRYVYGSARKAYAASTIVTKSTTPAAGLVVYFDKPTADYHVGFSLGGGYFLSGTVTSGIQNWGVSLNVVKITDYARIHDANYLGASATNGVNIPPTITDSLGTSTASDGSSPLTNGRYDMTTVYWDGQNPTGGAAQWALGGDSPGTTANWIVTKDKTLADKWAAVHGPAVDCGSAAAFAQTGTWYQQPVKVAGSIAGTSSGSDGATDMTATNALLTQVLAAVKALNPPG